VPLYEYQCNSCHTVTERIQKFSDPPLTICPHCGGELEQLLSAPAVRFKGAGWYVTDYARKGSARDQQDGKGSGSGDGKAECGSAESSKAQAPQTESSAAKENK
jgi:putative FmdB family regulatory protein